MAINEFLMLVKESAYGTPVATPVLGTDAIYIRLTDGNSFNVQSDPTMVEIPYGGGEAITAEVLSDVTETKGKLTTKLYHAQAAFFGHWLTERINAGQTTPWTTTEPPGDLVSVSAYHAYATGEGILIRKRAAGCKATDWTISASRTDPTWKLEVGISAQRTVGNDQDGSTDPDATEFPAPADADLPTGPFQFSDSAGHLTLGSGVRTQYDSLSIKCTNALDVHPFESRFPQVAAFRGRSITLSAALRLKATPDDRSAYEAITAQAAALAMTRGGVTLTVDMKGSNRITKLTRDLPLNKVFMHNLDLKSVRDATAGTDLTWVVS